MLLAAQEFASARKVRPSDRGEIHVSTVRIAGSPSAADEIVLRRSRGKAALWLLAALVLGFGAIGYAAKGGVGPILIGVVGGALFLGGAAWIAPDVVRPRILVRIGLDGVEQSVALPHAFVPWPAVTGISVVDRGHRVKCACVEVASADAIESRGRRLLRVEQSSLFARCAKVLLLPFVFLTEGLSGGASDARDVVTADLRLHGMEIPAVTGLPISADALAELLRSHWEIWKRAQSDAATSQRAPSA
jgi:hypothetical protein